MDECWSWWPVLEFQSPEEVAKVVAELGDDQTTIDWVKKRETPALEVDAEFLEQLDRASAVYHSLKAQLEQLYRIQQGLEPWPTVPVPDYKITGA
jgi:hypothetical protein